MGEWSEAGQALIVLSAGMTDYVANGKMCYANISSKNQRGAQLNWAPL